MADRRHVIDIIIEARDNTAAAFASAIGKQEAFKRLTDEQTKANERQRQSFDQINQDLRKQSTELAKARQEWSRFGDKAIEKENALVKASQERVRALADFAPGSREVEQATRNLEAAQNDYARSLQKSDDMQRTFSSNGAKARAERIRQIAEEIEQTKQLGRTYQEGAKAQADADRKAAQERAERQREAAELARELGRLESTERERRARELERQDRDELDRRRQIHRETLDMERDMAEISRATAGLRQAQNERDIENENRLAEAEADRHRRDQELAQEELRTREENQRQFLDDARARLAAIQNERRDAEEAAQAELRTREEVQRKFIDDARQRLTAIQNERRDAEESAQAELRAREEVQRRFIEDARVRLAAIQNERRDAEEAAQADIRAREDANKKFIEGARQRLTAIQNERRDNEEAARLNERRQERELSYAREYVTSLSEINRLEGQRADALRRGDTAAVVRIDLDATKARAEAEELAQHLRGILDHIEANVDVDGGAAMAHAAALREQLELLLGRDIKIDVDVDSHSLSNSLRSVGEDADRTSGRMGFLRGIVASVGTGFHDSSGKIASFDNYLRGLLSLGMAVFFNQLFLLAGAAGSALLALASSALYAGGALAGGLAAGLGQAIPMLGIFAMALYRLKAVFDAANQAQLLQQQQSYMGAKEHKRQADATDMVRSATERLAAAHRSVADAGQNVIQQQKDLSQARVDAANKLRDLILQERGLTLSMEDNDRAIRRATARGQTAALPALFLQRDQNLEQQATTRQEIGQRESGNAPEVVNAQRSLASARKQLADSKRAVDEAERSLAKAGRSATIADANITAAAGKLNFLLGRMSAAERHLFETVKRLQDVFRVAAQTITEPIIVAVDGAMQRLIRILQDPRIIGAARHLAGAMANVGTSIFNSFTNTGTLNQFMRLMKQGADSLKPIGDIVKNLGHAFLDMAEAGGPALQEMIGWLDGISKKIADFFREGRKSGDLQNFFKEGFTHLKAWGGSALVRSSSSSPPSLVPVGARRPA
jgi:hypothetical protein